MKDLEGRINEFRAYYKLKNVDIAQALGISKQAVGEWGKKATPSASSLQAIKDRWGISPDWLLNGRGPMLNDEKDSFVLAMATRSPYLSDQAKKILLDNAELLSKENPPN